MHTHMNTLPNLVEPIARAQWVTIHVRALAVMDEGEPGATTLPESGNGQYSDVKYSHGQYSDGLTVLSNWTKTHHHVCSICSRNRTTRGIGQSLACEREKR